jgi:hypothetical protein
VSGIVYHLEPFQDIAYPLLPSTQMSVGNGNQIHKASDHSFQRENATSVYHTKGSSTNEPEGRSASEGSSEVKDDPASRSTMASRWAFNAEKEKQGDHAYSKATSKQWFEKRDDLFSGQATVENVSTKLFKSLPVRSDNEKLNKSKKIVDVDTVSSPTKAKGRKDGKAEVAKVTPSHYNGSQTLNLSVKLTGANVMAQGGDNGWGERSKQSQAESFTRNTHSALRDPPPHLTTYRHEASDGADSWYGMSPESKRQQSHSKAIALPLIESLKVNYGYNEETQYILESIARMERENIGLRPYLLPEPH